MLTIPVIQYTAASAHVDSIHNLWVAPIKDRRGNLNSMKTL